MRGLSEGVGMSLSMLARRAKARRCTSIERNRLFADYSPRSPDKLLEGDVRRCGTG
jgi:hypothetical protein